MTSPEATTDVEFLVIGAGMSGLGFANWIRAERLARGRTLPATLVLETNAEPGGYCRTVVQDGFIWDYSGHFFHFRHPDIEAWLRARMGGAEVRTIVKQSVIRYAGRDIDFPFQKNIHQLPQAEFIDCLHDLYFRQPDPAPASFLAMLTARFGRSIADKFLVPYNEKLYACDLDTLDVDAMGRFFPHADIADIVRNMKQADNRSYNSTFSYPQGGAVQYVRALLHDLPPETVATEEALVAIDLEAKVATTTRRRVHYRSLVSSMPLPALLAACNLAHDPAAFSWNRVLVFNLGFDRKGRAGTHWMYFPDRARSFYRVGWYDNIFATDRMSLYVEIGAARGAHFDISETLARVLADLRAEGIVTDHRLISWHQVILDPGYVHISARSSAETQRTRSALAAHGVFSVGRYGGWTYCSIEDNLVETRDLARALA
jgi:protoporphyrinogen oxidase